MLLKLFRMIGLSCWIFADMFSHHMLVKMKFREKHCFGTNLTKISAIFPRPNVFSNDVDSKSVFYNAGKLLCYEIGKYDVSTMLHRQNIFHRVCRNEFFHFCERLWCETLSGNLINRLFHNNCTGDLDVCNICDHCYCEEFCNFCKNS